jgi:hypothetical protein
MYIHRLPLIRRPHGQVIFSADSALPFMTHVAKGCTVMLRCEDVRIVADVIELEGAQSFLGQRQGSYLRFRQEHVHSCWAPPGKDASAL